MHLLTQSFSILILLLSASPALSTGNIRRLSGNEVKCYAPDGSVAPNSTILPCNNLGITETGVVSSCCQLGGSGDGIKDLCAATGLCLDDGVVRRGYCTDPTFKSKACVGVCVDLSAGGNPSGFADMTSCTDGTYCCGRNNLTCCGTKWAIKPPSVMSTMANSTEATTTNTGVVVGLGATIGAVVIIAGSLILLLWRRVRILQRSAVQTARGTPLLDLRGDPAPGSGKLPPTGWTSPDGTLLMSAEGVPRMGDARSGLVRAEYVHPLLRAQQVQEMDYTGVYRPSELYAGDAAELGEDGRPVYEAPGERSPRAGPEWPLRGG
ncbi:hypothetical protein QBC47DRAFT_126107 [Echria macrotheca]|uniref:Uncharacterized protein n=1 Tax=Echria macrotheca TaxID=438768 RepID=A0AAJ0F1N1_9PEZI|nr:hypothetical protein QBC47DRAFT_126107 [Echria macrotheca]